jgi:Fur family peroxide stress response transcriptional regulator
MSEIKKEELITLLRKNGLKATPQRLAICEFVLSSKNHPTAETILAEIRKEHRTVSQATVYKTLTLLRNLGLISELSFDNSHSRFDPNQEVHINIVCPSCEMISDHESDLVQDFWQDISLEIGEGIIGKRFDVYKTCNKCQSK